MRTRVSAAGREQRSRVNPDDLILPRAGLAHCFTQLAEAADQIVATTTFQPG